MDIYFICLLRLLHTCKGRLGFTWHLGALVQIPLSSILLNLALEKQKSSLFFFYFERKHLRAATIHRAVTCFAVLSSRTRNEHLSWNKTCGSYCTTLDSFQQDKNIS